MAATILLAPTLIALRGRWDKCGSIARASALYKIVAIVGEQACFVLALQHLSVALAILMEMMGVPQITAL